MYQAPMIWVLTMARLILIQVKSNHVTIAMRKEKNEPPADVDGYDGAGLAPTHEPTALKTVKPNMDSEGLSTSPTVTPTIATTDAEPAVTNAPTTADEPEWKIRQDEERAASRAKRAEKEGKHTEDNGGEPEWKIRQDEERAASRAKRAEKEGK